MRKDRGDKAPDSEHQEEMARYQGFMEHRKILHDGT